MEGRKSEEGNSIAIFVILIAMISSIIFTITQNEVDGSSFAEEISGSYTMMNGDLVIDGDEDFEENENITGNGTKEDPYQISGLDMGEFSIIVKNTDSYLKISKLKLGTNNDDYRMIFYNNDHIIIDNLSVEARFFIDGDFCNELIIRNSYLYTRDSEDFIIYDNIISLNITSSTFQYNRSIGYQKAMVEFYGNFGNTWIYNSTFSGIDLSSQIYGKQIWNTVNSKVVFFVPEVCLKKVR